MTRQLLKTEVIRNAIAFLGEATTEEVREYLLCNKPPTEQLNVSGLLSYLALRNEIHYVREIRAWRKGPRPRAPKVER